ncbi:MAG: hypothetical protein WD824_21185 [Cyclobacteriaceae bacterium]
MNYVQCTSVIFHLWCCQIKCQHEFIFRDGQVKGLFNGLWLHAKFSQDIDHLVGITGIPAEPVPFQEKYKVTLSPMFTKVGQVLLPFRAIKRFGRMILIDHLPYIQFIDVAISAKQFLLAALRVSFVGLFIGAYPYVEIGCFHRRRI